MIRRRGWQSRRFRFFQAKQGLVLTELVHKIRSWLMQYPFKFKWRREQLQIFSEVNGLLANIVLV